VTRARICDRLWQPHVAHRDHGALDEDPAVVGLKTITSDLRTGDTVLLDGVSGLIIINPTDQTLFQYGQLARRQKSLDEKLHENHGKPRSRSTAIASHCREHRTRGRF